MGSGGPYLAIEPIKRHGGVGRPQHAHGGCGHVREHGFVSPPPFLLLRARVRVRAPRPPRRLHGQVSGQVRAPPCSEQPQPPLGTSRPTPLRPETRLGPLRDAGRGLKGKPAPAAERDAPPSRTPEPSHSVRKGRPPITLEGRSREALLCLAIPGLSPPLPWLPGCWGGYAQSGATEAGLPGYG